MKYFMQYKRKLVDRILDWRYAFYIAVSFFILLILIFICGNPAYRILCLISTTEEEMEILLTSIRNNADFLWSTIWIMMFILAVMLVYFYNNTGYKNYGLSNRNVISYTFGTFFVPMLYMLNILVVIMATVAVYKLCYAQLYYLIAYSLILQAVLIAICIYSTSQKHCRTVILQSEQEEFAILLEKYRSYCMSNNRNKNEDNQNESNQNKDDFAILESVKNKFVFHSDYCLSGDETPSEKMELMNDLNSIPFGSRFWSAESVPGCVYYYLSHNFHAILHEGETQTNEDFIYDILYEGYHRIATTEGASEAENSSLRKRFIYIGALFNALIPAKFMEKRWEFIAAFLENNVNFTLDDKKDAIVILLMSVYFSDCVLNYDDADNCENLKSSEAFLRLGEFRKEKDGAVDFYNRALSNKSILCSWVEDVLEEQELCFRIVSGFYSNIDIIEKRPNLTDYLFQICVKGSA